MTFISTDWKWGMKKNCALEGGEKKFAFIQEKGQSKRKKAGEY